MFKPKKPDFPPNKLLCPDQTFKDLRRAYGVEPSSIIRFLAKRFSMLFPNHCGKCGNMLIQLELRDLPLEIQEKHKEGGTTWAFHGKYIFRCALKCEEEYTAIMRM